MKILKDSKSKFPHLSDLVGERMTFVLHVRWRVRVRRRSPVVHAWFTSHGPRLSLHLSLHRSLMSHLWAHPWVTLWSHVLWSHWVLSGSHGSVAHGWSSGSVHTCRSVHVLLLGVMMILLVILCILSHLDWCTTMERIDRSTEPTRRRDKRK